MNQQAEDAQRALALFERIAQALEDIATVMTEKADRKRKKRYFKQQIDNHIIEMRIANTEEKLRWQQAVRETFPGQGVGE